MAVKIKLKRVGKMRQAQYRVIVADARTKRDGRAIEEIGHYHPKEHPSFIQINRERAQYWLGVGAQPTEAVAVLLKITGDWQTFKGLPGTEGTLLQPEPRVDKKILFEAAAKESLDQPTGLAITPKAKKAPKADVAAAEAPADVVPDVVAEVVAEAPVEPVVEPVAQAAVEAEPVVEPVAEAAVEPEQA